MTKRFIQKSIQNEILYDMIYDTLEKKECCRLCSALTEQEQEVAKVVDLLNKQEEKIKSLHRERGSLLLFNEVFLTEKEKFEKENKVLNSFLVSKGLAEEYVKWKKVIDDD